ncbi:MAG TPA: helix-turn-helix domain-containing protein [Burkholderiaceae bacterium]
MDKRKKPLDRDSARIARAELYAAIENSELSLTEAVKRMRKLSQLTQAEFAAHRGLGTRVIKEIEQGSANPTVRTLNQIGEFFGLEVAFVRRAGRKDAPAARQNTGVAQPRDTVQQSAAENPLHQYRTAIAPADSVAGRVHGTTKPTK